MTWHAEGSDPPLGSAPMTGDDVVIVGGGPVGLLNALGWRARVSA